MAVVSNSSPLIALTQIGRLHLLGQPHPYVLIPPAVASEVEPSIPDLPGWLVVQPLVLPRQPPKVSGSIGPGEHEVISLGLELRAERLILDEQPARRLASSLGLRVIGTVGLLLAAKHRGFLTTIGQHWIGCWQPGSSWTRSFTTASSVRPENNSRSSGAFEVAEWDAPLKPASENGASSPKHPRPHLLTTPTSKSWD